MDPRTTAHVLTRIADLLELRGENRFKTRAYRGAAKAVLGLQVADLGPLRRSGSLQDVPGLGPATIRVIEELVDTGDSAYFDQLREDTPEGLLEMLRVPGLGTAKIHQIHEELGIETLHELEEATRDGRIATMRGFGPRTAEKIRNGISQLRESSQFVLYPHAFAESARLLADVLRHPDVSHAAVAGSVRRRREIVRDVDIVAACTSAPETVAASFARAPGVQQAVGVGSPSVSIRYVDGTRLDLHCVSPERFPAALWRATGTAEHVLRVRQLGDEIGVRVDGDTLREGDGPPIPLSDERALYAAFGLSYVEPELREDTGEVDAARTGTLPDLIQLTDLRGVLHCHSDYSDGKTSIRTMAEAARARGWSYIGISDHSQSAFYAGGLTRDSVLRQHEEIERVNEELGGTVRVLKGIEADILLDGGVDYEPELLDRFDYVIASVHSRFGLGETAMTERVLRALDHPHVLVLGHPTGRLLLTREAYAIDMEAVLQKAAEVGVVVELNADPHRLDLDWRLCRRAKELGCLLEIGPDAHSVQGLDYVELGIGIARKAWLEAADVLNTREADDVVALAQKRRDR